MALMQSRALAYAARGLRVFPLVPGGKVPLLPRCHHEGETCHGECGQDGHGCLDATTDAERVREFPAERSP